MTAVVLLASLSGCTMPVNTDIAPGPVLEPSEIPPPPVPPSAAGVTDAMTDFRRDFDNLAASMSGDVGLAVVAVGSDDVASFGSLTDGSAWSTIKVPLSLAAVRQSGLDASSSVTNAIVESDNSAAELLWESLGNPESAANAVTAILRDGGDLDTVVPSRRTRSEYSIFGQTQWPLTRQAVFAAHLPCVAGSSDVLNLMSNISSGQQWGLGTISGSAFKGGWGPDASTGGYLVRQFGILTSVLGQTSVAIAAQPVSGSFGDGTGMLDTLAGFITERLDHLPAGSCTR